MTRSRWVGRLITVVLCVALAPVAVAQDQALPPDLAGVPEYVKAGQWKSIDLAGLTPLERCRALYLLNHVLDELRGMATTQADLLSTYIEQHDLGAQFAAQEIAAPPGQLSYDDAQKIAVGLLRGPLSKSAAATELADTPPNGLQAYAHMYDATCQLRWSELTAAGRHVRCMGRFLKAQNKLDDFRQWAPGEVSRRQQDYEAEMARRRAASHDRAAAEHAQAEQARQQHEQQQAAQAQAQAQAQAESAQAQQSLLAAQQAAAQAVSTTGNDNDDDCWGLNYYGAISNLQRAAWVRDPAVLGQARAATENRVANWHGAGGALRR